MKISFKCISVLLLFFDSLYTNYANIYVYYIESKSVHKDLYIMYVYFIDSKNYLCIIIHILCILWHNTKILWNECVYVTIGIIIWVTLQFLLTIFWSNWIISVDTHCVSTNWYNCDSTILASMMYIVWKYYQCSYHTCRYSGITLIILCATTTTDSVLVWLKKLLQV